MIKPLINRKNNHEENNCDKDNWKKIHVKILYNEHKYKYLYNL